VFNWLKSLFGLRRGVASSPGLGIRARYENALSNDENARQWAQIDYLSAKSANNFNIRRTLRNRSRYEASNNPYLYGVATGNANDLVNTGPKLQCKFSEKAKNRQVENAWLEWWAEVDMVEKLRTCKLAKTIDGEGFLVFKTNSDQQHPVKLYPVDIEADQVTAAMAKDLQDTWLDGVSLNPVTGRPTAYTILRNHPGDYLFPGLDALAADRIKARHVIHWFVKFRPGQIRGVPAFTTALDLFAEQRSYRRAVLSKANIAANLTAVLETEGPPDNGDNTAKPFVNVPIDRGTMTVLPGNAKFKQYETGDPSTTYEVFQEKCLGEACRPLCYPLNLALGTSQKFNFSSARLDHLNYRDALDVERDDCNRNVLDRIFSAWLEEAVLIPGYLPSGIESLIDVPHEWHWPGYVPLDAVADARADHERLSNGTMTWQQFWASRGMDWQQVMAQQAAEKREVDLLGLIFGDPLKKTDRIDETLGDRNAA